MEPRVRERSPGSPRGLGGPTALLLLLLACSQPAPGPCDHPAAPVTTTVAPLGNIRTVFLLLLENHDWADILGSSSAPYINQVLLPAASHSEAHYNPPGLHPSEPNYLWLEGGTSYGVANDDPPAANHVPYRDHLVTQLEAAGISWTSYQEGISGTDCPLVDRGLYAPRHDPMVFFDDVTDGNDPASARCIAHVRPMDELVPALRANTVSRYVFITPDLCHDMHNSSGCATPDAVRNGDDWLRGMVPEILASQAYQDRGTLLVTWDESENGDHPIGMIALSPLARGGGYASTVHTTHGSTLRTVQEIFGVRPVLYDAAASTDLSDLFTSFP